MSRFNFVLFLLVISFTSMAQREKQPSYFGIQIRPIFPSSFGGSKTLELTGENYKFKLTQTVGYSFGGTIRKGITKLIAFESGLNFTHRSFRNTMSLTDTSVMADDKWSFDSYDIPINALVYIQLSQKIYMNTSMGLALRISPNDIKKITETGGAHSFTNIGRYTAKIGFNLNANVGFEYRTREKGFFYFGGSIGVPLKPIIELYSLHSVIKQTHVTQLKGMVNGNYLAIDLKYFFPLISKKGDQPLKGPIE